MTYWVFAALIASSLSALGCADSSQCPAYLGIESLTDSLSVNLTYGVTYRDIPRVIYVDEEGGLTAYWDLPYYEPFDFSLPLIRPVSVMPLAWQVVSFDKWVFRSVLVGFKVKENIVGGQEYGLAIYTVDTFETEPASRVRWHMDCNFDTVLKRFSAPPTNDDILSLINSDFMYEHERGRKFGPVSQRWLLFDEAGSYNWNGVVFTLREGGVCAENWKEFIGMEPLSLPTTPSSTSD